MTSVPHDAAFFAGRPALTLIRELLHFLCQHFLDSYAPEAAREAKRHPTLSGTGGAARAPTAHDASTWMTTTSTTGLTAAVTIRRTAPASAKSTTCAAYMGSIKLTGEAPHGLTWQIGLFPAASPHGGEGTRVR